MCDIPVICRGYKSHITWQNIINLYQFPFKTPQIAKRPSKPRLLPSAARPSLWCVCRLKIRRFPSLSCEKVGFLEVLQD